MWIPTGRPAAIASISGEGNLRGTVTFYPTAGGVLVAAQIRGLPESTSGFFALHVHEGRSCGGLDFAGSGAHFNPEGQSHPRHAGDLPPLLSRNGNAFLAVETDRFHLREIIGRTVVIHSGADDFRTQPAGDSGRKIGCGIIRPIINGG